MDGSPAQARLRSFDSNHTAAAVVAGRPESAVALVEAIVGVGVSGDHVDSEELKVVV